MKVKNLWVGVVDKNDIEKVVIIREVSFLKKVIKLSLDDHDDEYKCIFTNKKVVFKRTDIAPFVLFLSIEQAKKRMSKNEIREIYKEQEENMRMKLTRRPKHIMGFRKE